MHVSRILLGTILCLIGTLAHAAGLRFVEIPADVAGPAMKGAIWYPCPAPPIQFDLDGWTLRAARDCPFSGEKLPLVVASHGNGGSMLVHHDLAETLADAGFIFAAIDHPGDSTPDRSRIADLSVHVERPTDIKRLIDFMLDKSPVASRIDARRIGFFGFSAGGYTGLVLIGANPDWATDLCQNSPAASACAEILRNEFHAQPLVHDWRIKAAVIADPACCFFRADSFAAVKAPVQLWASEHGGRGLPTTNPHISPDSAALIDRNLPGKHEYHVVPNAGHFAFLPPCSPELVTGFAEGCTDAPGFDRAEFHHVFNSMVLSFFHANLGVK